MEGTVMHGSRIAQRQVQPTNRGKKAARKDAILPDQNCELPDETSFPNPDGRDASVVVDNELWIQQNFSECDFGHVLRTKRLMIMARNMLASPDSSLPEQNGEWSDIKAAYRFFDREEVTFDAIRQRHEESTRQTPPGVYLMISDTTDINHFTHKATKGLGMLGDGKGRGMQLHSCLVVDAVTGVVQGTAAATVFYRKNAPENETRSQRLARGRESDLWGEVTEKLGRPPEGSQWIHVWDRGGDNFEAMCYIVQNGCDWLIRASKLNRTVQQGSENVKMEVAVSRAELLGSYDMHLRARPGASARVASLEVRSTRVTLPQPKASSPFVKSCGIESIETNLLIAEEVNAPKGITPIRWILMTSLPVSSLEEAWTGLSNYEKRWLIEEYHKVLKTGCSIETHALRTAERLEPLIALISVIGVRLLSLKTICRHEPEAKAKDRVPDVWLTVLLLMKPKLAKQDLTVYGFFRGLAKLGGFLGRKHDGEPGWQSIWRGYEKLHGRIEGIKLVRPDWFRG